MESCLCIKIFDFPCLVSDEILSLYTALSETSGTLRMRMNTSGKTRHVIVGILVRCFAEHDVVSVGETCESRDKTFTHETSLILKRRKNQLLIEQTFNFLHWSDVLDCFQKIAMCLRPSALSTNTFK